MEYLIDKYLHKLHAQGLAEPEDAAFLFLDAELSSNKPLEGDLLNLAAIFRRMNINTLLLAAPSEPYMSIINEILAYDSEYTERGRIIPSDCETKTFFHDIPVIPDLIPELIVQALSHRKSVIVKDRGIITYGTVSPEQAFVSFSSACFSTFVKYFDDLISFVENRHKYQNIATDSFLDNFKKITISLSPLIAGHAIPLLKAGAPASEDEVVAMLCEAGRAVVSHHLVDSHFGNISYAFGDTLYISQTGSSLDELETCIDAVPFNGSSSVGITASSEFSAHKKICLETSDHAILHGHPKFSVIMSLCESRRNASSCIAPGYCGDVCGTPIVSGEIGTGPTGLVHTVPPALKENKGVIVCGHGVFTSGAADFNGPFQELLSIEQKSREAYLERAMELLV